MSVVPGTTERVFYNAPNIDMEGYASGDRYQAPEALANLVSSQIKDSAKHAPALDLDVPAFLVPSSTEGHSHLYLDVEMTWKQYEKLLTVLGEVGILQPGYVSASLERKGTHLRKPGVKKAAA